MVTISNPAVSSKDVWEYKTRELSSFDNLSPNLINALFNSIMGSNFDVNSYGQWIVDGISQKTANLINKANYQDYVLSIPLMPDEANFNFSYCRCKASYASWSQVGDSGDKFDSKLLGEVTVFNDGIGIEAVKNICIAAFRVLSPECDPNVTTTAQLVVWGSINNTASNGVYKSTKYKVRYKNEDLYLCDAMFNNAANYIQLYPNVTGLNSDSFTSPGTAVEVGMFAQNAPLIVSDIWTNVTIQKNCALSRISISLPFGSLDNYNFELEVNNTIVYNGTLETGKDVLDSGDITETIPLTPASIVRFRFTRQSESTIKFIPIKGITIRVLNSTV